MSLQTGAMQKGSKHKEFPKKFLGFFGPFLGPPGAGNGPKMWPLRPAFEPQSIVQIRPMAARLVAKLRFGKILLCPRYIAPVCKPLGRAPAAPLPRWQGGRRGRRRGSRGGMCRVGDKGVLILPKQCVIRAETGVCGPILPVRLLLGVLLPDL